MRKIKWIVFHCTGANQNQSLQSILDYWKNKGWKTPGYHHLTMPNGKRHNLVPIEKPSNGVLGFNKESINVCYVGGVEKFGKIVDNRTAEQKEDLKQLAFYYKGMFPDAIITGHRDFSPDKNRNGIIEPSEWYKSCPSFSVAEWLKEIGLTKNPIKPVVKKAVSTLRGGPVNIRESSGLESAIVGKVASGTVCILIEEKEGWSNVIVNDKLKGYIRSDFLR